MVCLEASTWQDYGGGIITADSGCGQEFLDMNHCVQVVGYAFTDGSSCNGGGGSGSEDNNNEDCDDGNNQSGSGSGSNSGSNDSGGRDGYWIVRNQWGKFSKSLLMGSGIHPFCILFFVVVFLLTVINFNFLLVLFSSFLPIPTRFKIRKAKIGV